MNVDTGEIKPVNDLTEEEKLSGKYTRLSAAEATALREIPAAERPALLRHRRGTKKRRDAIARKSRRVNRQRS